MGTPPARAELSPALLLRLRTDASPKVRLQAAILLGKETDPGRVEPLLEALKDPHAAVRAAAAHGLGGSGDPRCLGPLRGASEDPDPLVRGAASTALRSLEAAIAAPEGLEVAGPGLASSRDPAAVQALVAGLQPGLLRCATRQLKRDPAFSGIDLDFRVDPQGRAVGLRTAPPQPPDSRLAQCLAEVLAGLRAPVARGGDLRVQLPLRVQR